MGLFDLLKGKFKPKPKMAWPPQSSFVGLFLFNPSEKSFRSLEAVRKHAEAAVLSSLSKTLVSARELDALQPNLCGVSGPFMMGGLPVPGMTSSVQILEQVLRRKDGGVQSFDLQYTELPHFSFDSYLVCLMPLRKEQIRKLHGELKVCGTPHYEGAVSIHASLEEAAELTARLDLGLLRTITSESAGKGAI